MTVTPPAGRDARYDLVFFDSAGEVQQTGQDVAVHSPFVQLMDAALLFYTPKALRFPREVYRLPGEELSQTAPGPSRVVGTLTTLLAQLSQHPSYVGRHPTRDLPVAAVLSKADELVDLLPAEFGGRSSAAWRWTPATSTTRWAARRSRDSCRTRSLAVTAGPASCRPSNSCPGCGATTRCRRWDVSRMSRACSRTTGRST